MTNIAIFASGNGTNCENIIKYFHSNNDINVNLVICNKKDAYVLTRASNYNIPNKVLTKTEINSSDVILPLLEEYNINFIVLAGFLLMIPDFLIEKFKNKIINIHPSLLPKFGGKGMYGHHVHEAVKAANEPETGITIHFVSNVCDGGDIIRQFKTPLEPNDTIEVIENKVHELEQKYFPKTIEEVIISQNNNLS